MKTRTTYEDLLTERDVNQLTQTVSAFGVAVVPDYLNTTQLNQLNAEFDQILNEPDTGYKQNTPYSVGQCARVIRQKLDAVKYPDLSAVFSSEFMQEVLTEAWSPKARLNSEIFVVRDVVGSRHIANDMHFDVKPTFKFFIYLTDTNVENGAFTCVPGSHKKTREIRATHKGPITYDKREESRKLDYAPEDVVPIVGKAGTLIIFSTETFHQAGTVSKGERRVLRGHCRTPQQERMGSASLVSRVRGLLNVN